MKFKKKKKGEMLLQAKAKEKAGKRESPKSPCLDFSDHGHPGVCSGDSHCYVPVCYHAGKLYGTDHLCGGSFLYGPCQL